MFFLWGWGHQKIKNHGPVMKHKCTNCGHNSFWSLFSISTWFTFFFIPIIPYERFKILSCPICNNFSKLSDLQFEYYNWIAETNLKYNNSEITKEEYLENLKEVNEVFNSLNK